MSDVRTHYEELLAPVYTWMSGGAEERLAANRSFFAAHALEPGSLKGALDLGAGSGFQSIALAELGFSVTAVDLSPTLLGELRSRAGALSIHTLEQNFLPLTELVNEPQQLVVCMGDTLSHLADHGEVEALIAGSAQVLAPGGRVVLGWRSLQTLPQGDGRFLPVRSDQGRIFTCFLEELDQLHVRVTDLVHERREDGFVQHVSSYTKLRIAPALVDTLLARHGFAVDVATADKGLVTRIATLTRG